MSLRVKQLKVASLLQCLERLSNPSPHRNFGACTSEVL